MSRWVVGGVSGSGKTTVGKVLALRLGVEFLDADDFHPEENVEKMASGVALTDEDRVVWLERLVGVLRQREDVVLACSALKRAYRQVLEGAGEIRWVMLEAGRGVIEARMRERRGHFMPVSLLDSQWALFELGEEKERVLNEGAVEAVVDEILKRWGIE